MHKVFTTLDKVGSKFEVREIIMSVQKKNKIRIPERIILQLFSVTFTIVPI